MKKKVCVRARVLKFSLTWRHEREKLSHKGISSLEIVKKKGEKKYPTFHSSRSSDTFLRRQYTRDDDDDDDDDCHHLYREE